MRKSIVVLIPLILLSVCSLAAMSVETITVPLRLEVSEETTPPAVAKTVVEGLVVDLNGKPIANAHVYPNTTVVSKDSEKLYTDKNGRIRYTPNIDSSGWISFVAVADGYSYNIAYRRPGESGELKIALAPEYKLKGKIVDEGGKPVPDATVTCSCTAYTNTARQQIWYPSGGDSEVTTDKDGAFTFRHLPAPDQASYYDLRISVRKNGRAFFNKSFQKEDLGKPIKIVQPRECVIEGTIYLPDKTGPAPKGTHVRVWLPPQWGGMQREGVTDEEGNFRVDQLPRSRAAVMLSPTYQYRGEDDAPPPLKPWKAKAVTDLWLRSGRPAKVELVLTPGAVVKGVVKNKGTGDPFPKAELRIQHGGTSSEAHEGDLVAVNDKGEFSARVVPGEVRIIAQRLAEGYLQWEDAPYISTTVADGEEKNDLVISAVPNYFEAQRKPAPADFELVAGVYDLSWDPELKYSAGGYINATKADKAAIATLKGRPKKLVSKNVEYRAYRLDGRDKNGLLAIALDESKGTGKGYDTIYMDRNRNWDLSDDKPVKMTCAGDQGQSDWIEVHSRQGAHWGEQTNHPVKIKVHYFRPQGENKIYLNISRQGGWKGLIDTSKGKVECAAVDGNGDGKCGGVASWYGGSHPSATPDLVYVDNNGYGEVLTEGYGSHGVALHPIAQVGSKFYTIRVSPLGDKLTVNPYTGPTGTLLIRATNIKGMKGPAKDVAVRGKGAIYQSRGNVAEPIALPAGSYHIMQCGLSLESEKTKAFDISCEFPSDIVIKADEQTTVDIAGQVTLAIEPDTKKIVWQPGQTTTFLWSAKIGDNAVLGSLRSNNGSSAPTVKFLDQNGKLLRTVTAGYT